MDRSHAGILKRMTVNFNYYLPTKLLFGKGQLSRLHTQALPGKKALIVISAGGSVKKYGYLQRLTAELDKADAAYVIFDKILPNPIKPHVMEAAAIAKDEGCDFIIGFGGGSAIDAAKAIAIMAANEGDLWDYFGGGTARANPIPKLPLPVVAITTTAGTGTEADPWMVITNDQTHEKIGFGNDATFPVLSIVDPDLMMSVPPELTAFQGFDALFHSTEGYINRVANPVSDLLALKSISLIGKSLAAAVRDGCNEQARTDVALANTLSGMVESTSNCTSEHAMEHALSGSHPELPHGAGLIMISSAYYTHLAESGACNERLVDMAKALGCTEAKEPMDFVKALEELKADCRVDALKMSAYGITKNEMPALARLARAVGAGMYAGEPRPMSDEDITAILERSFR
jgi:alcohol dehydrogenase